MRTLMNHLENQTMVQLKGEPRFFIQINDWDRWLVRKNKSLWLYTTRAFKTKYVNLFLYDEALEQFLVNNNIDYQVESEEEYLVQKPTLYIKK